MVHARAEGSRTRSQDHLAEWAVTLAEYHDIVGRDLLLYKRFRGHLGSSIVGTSLVFAFRAWQGVGISDARCNYEGNYQTSDSLHYDAIETRREGRGGWRSTSTPPPLHLSEAADRILPMCCIGLCDHCEHCYTDFRQLNGP